MLAPHFGTFYADSSRVVQTISRRAGSAARFKGEKEKCRDFSHRGIPTLFGLLPDSLKRAFARFWLHLPLRSEPVSITARKAFAIRAGVVAKACIMKVVRPFRVVTSMVLGVAAAGPQTVVITLVLGSG
jgi:hypothetical protein